MPFRSTCILFSYLVITEGGRLSGGRSAPPGRRTFVLYLGGTALPAPFFLCIQAFSCLVRRRAASFCSVLRKKVCTIPSKPSGETSFCSLRLSLGNYGLPLLVRQRLTNLGGRAFSIFHRYLLRRRVIARVPCRCPLGVILPCGLLLYMGGSAGSAGIGRGKFSSARLTCSARRRTLSLSHKHSYPYSAALSPRSAMRAAFCLTSDCIYSSLSVALLCLPACRSADASRYGWARGILDDAITGATGVNAYRGRPSSRY